MMPVPHETKYNAPLRQVAVIFKDTTTVTDLLRPAHEEPEWLQTPGPQYRRRTFWPYSMYTIIKLNNKVSTYNSESTAPRYADVRDSEKHFPVEAQLRVDVGEWTEVFESEFFEPYVSYEKLKILPFWGPHGKVFGYIFITIKDTTNIYVGHIHIHNREPNEHAHAHAGFSYSGEIVPATDR